jgi:hypothetical protein
MNEEGGSKVEDLERDERGIQPHGKLCLSNLRRQNLIAIHRSAVEVCKEIVHHHRPKCTLRDWNESRKLEKLQILRRRRIHLAAQLSQKRLHIQQTRAETIASQLLNRRDDQKPKDPNHLEDIPPEKPKVVPVSGNAEDIVEQVVSHRNLAIRMRSIRQQKCIAAANKLLGISINRFQEYWVLRFDVGKKQCFHCFLDLFPVAQNSHEQSKDTSITKQYQWRMAQHTLPAAIPWEELWKRNFPNATYHKPTHLRSFARQVYQACYHWDQRNSTWEYLQMLVPSKEHTPSKQPDRQQQRSADQLSYVSHLKRIPAVEGRGDVMKFRIHHVLASFAAAEVELLFPLDLTLPDNRPMVHVTILNSENHAVRTEGQQRRKGDHYAYDLFIEQATMAFRRYNIRTAIQHVTKAMEDC